MIAEEEIYQIRCFMRKKIEMLLIKFCLVKGKREPELTPTVQAGKRRK